MKSNELNATKLNEYFELSDKKLRLKRTYDLDSVQVDFIELIFYCRSLNNNYRNTFQLYLTVNDINNRVPTFLDTPYKFELEELTPIGSTVYNGIRAVDGDLPNKPNSQISFRIMKGDCSDYFEFPLSTKPDLVVKKQIHYDTLKHCELRIQAEVCLN